MKTLPVGPVGPSTGWLCAKLDTSLESHARILERSGATAAEMVCHRERMRDMLQGRLPEHLRFVSLHLTRLDRFTPSDDAAELAGELWHLRTLVDTHHIQAAPTHPEVTPAFLYPVLLAQGIPVCIENMDRQKSMGKLPEEIAALCDRFGARSILDVQHAYEVSRDMGGDGIELSARFAEAANAGNGLSHLHVSGEIVRQEMQQNNHAPLRVATNRREIMQAVRSVLERTSKSLPVILEGETLLGIPEGYVPHDASEQNELEERCAAEIRGDIECLLNGINA